MLPLDRQTTDKHVYTYLTYRNNAMLEVIEMSEGIAMLIDWYIWCQ